MKPNKKYVNKKRVAVIVSTKFTVELDLNTLRFHVKIAGDENDGLTLPELMEAAVTLDLAYRRSRLLGLFHDHEIERIEAQIERRITDAS